MPKLSKELSGYFNESLEHIVTYQDSLLRITKQLKIFEKSVTQMAMENDHFHLSKAQELIAMSWAVLDLCRKNLHAKMVPYCLAAVDYLLDSEDAIADLDGFDGFDDDEKVLKSVILKYDLKITPKVS